VYKQEGKATWVEFVTATLHTVFYVTMAVWHVLEAFLSPPSGKPDLWVVGNVGVGAVGFGICYLWCLWSLITEGGWVVSKIEKRKIKS
jgi:alpha-1,3-glucosyltransferase